MIKIPPDITFVIQLVGFVVFWQLMRVLLFTPMQQALKTRAERTDGARTRAEALVAEAAQIAASIQTGLAEAKKDGARRAEDWASDLLEGEGMRSWNAIGSSRRRSSSANARSRTRRSSRRGPLETEASRLAENVVRRVLGRAA